MNEVDTAEVAELTELLRRMKPNTLRAITREGEGREVACGTGRGARWSHIARTVLAWSADLERVELCDKRGALLETWRPKQEPETPDPAGDLGGVDELQELREQGSARTLDLRGALTFASIVQRATDHAVDRHLRGMRDVVEGLLTIIKLQEARNAQLERQMTGSLKLAYEATRARAELEVMHGQQADPTEGLVTQVLAGALAQQAQGAAHGPNGKPGKA